MLRENVDALSSLQEEADQYGRPSILDNQIREMEAFLTDEKERSKKVSTNMAEAYQVFNEDWKYL